MITKIQRGRIAIAATLMGFAVTATAAPKVKQPGFYFTTLGASLEDVNRQPFTDGEFNGLYKASAFAFADNADVVFVAEKEGRIRVIVDGVLQQSAVVDMRDQVATWVDRGLGGIDVHPEFPDVKELLVTYTHENGVTAEDGPKYAKVARVKLRETRSEDGVVEYFGNPPEADDVILGRLSATTRFPSCNDRPLGADCGAVDGGSHSFTFVRYGPDGMVYVGTGDGAGFYKPEPAAFYAQRLEHLAGKVLRVMPDGSAPDDNPYFTGNPQDNASKVFALGLRNPKSGSFDPDTGALCVGNVGWFLNEGVYCLSPGDNAGWPCQENGPVRNGYQTLSLTRDGERLASCPMEPGSWVEPDFAYPHVPMELGGEILPVGAIIGCAIADAAEYPDEFNGSCFHADYVIDTLSSVVLDTGATNPSAIVHVEGAGSPTDVSLDRQGRVCWLSYDVGIADGIPVSEVRCLRYDATGDVEQLPVASFDVAPDVGLPLGINVNASSSFHPGGLDLEFVWDFGDGSGAIGERAAHEYATFGDVEIALTAIASDGGTASTSRPIRIDNPDLFIPVLPLVVSIEYLSDEHFLSSEVGFSATLRNDLGEGRMHVLANIYDKNLREVAHLVHPEVIELGMGEETTVDFLWSSASGLGEHAVSIEFYAEDWVSWTLKYPQLSSFQVRNRVNASVEADGERDPDAIEQLAVTDSSDTQANSSRPRGSGIGAFGTVMVLLSILMFVYRCSVSTCARLERTIAARRGCSQQSLADPHPTASIRRTLWRPHG